MTTSMMSATTALVASFGPPAEAPSPAHAGHERAVQDLLTVEVELYCDHDAAAIFALRRTYRSLLRDAHPAVAALRSLDDAAWHIRHHEMREAVQAIDQARDSLG